MQARFTGTLLLLFCLSVLWCGSSVSLTVEVNPVTGTDDGSSPFRTIAAALVAVAGADSAPDVVNLRSNGVHVLENLLTVSTSASDGDLLIQTLPSDPAPAIIRLSGQSSPGAGNPPEIAINLYGGTTLELANLVIIGATGSGALGGDGIRIINSNPTAGIATCNITDCTFAANDGTERPARYYTPITTAGLSYPGDDWIDYFENTAGTLTRVFISHAGDEGVIVRGATTPGDQGAQITMTAGSVVSHCGGRAFQTAFGGSGDNTVPVVNLLGSAEQRIRVFGNCELVAEPTITWFNGRITMEYVDVVGNRDHAIRVDTDTCDSFLMNYCRVAYNGNGTSVHNGIIFLFATGDLSDATVSNCTFHDQNGPGDAFNVDAEVTSINIHVVDSIFTGNGPLLPSDQINLATDTTALVEFSHCAIVQQERYSLAVPALPHRSATESNTISRSPEYVSVFFKPADRANTNFLRVTDKNPEYVTGSSTGGELVGGNGNPILRLTGVRESWEDYR